MRERLQKVIASAGICSRRQAERLIAEGEVLVNGERVLKQGMRVDPSRDSITVKGRRVRVEVPRLYLALHKPRGCVTTLRDPEGRPTVHDLIRGDVKARLYPVGRLDYNAEGLILMTNDGEMAYSLMRPGGLPKTYRVKVKGSPSRETVERLRAGLRLDGWPLLPVKIIVEALGDNSWLKMTLHEGKKNQIVRMMEAVGHPVRRLRRVGIGSLRLGSLAPGRWRPLDPVEIKALKGAVAASEAGRAGGGHAAPKPGRPRRRMRPSQRRRGAPASGG